MKPEDVPQWAWDEADETTYNIETDGHGSIEYTEARASIARLVMKARSQAFEEIAAYVEGKDGKIPAAAVFAPLVSQNRMPDMSGDPRARLSPPRRREFDDATRALSQAIRQHSQKGRDTE